MGRSSKAADAAGSKATRKLPAQDAPKANPKTKRAGKGEGRSARAGRHVLPPAPKRSPVAEAPPPRPIPAEDVKLVRDSFTMPGEDFELIAQLKARALEFKRPTKKSELLRAGLQQLAALTETQLHDALAALRPLPTGRPKKKR